MATPKCGRCGSHPIRNVCRQCRREICQYCTCGSPIGAVCGGCINAVWEKIRAEQKKQNEAEAAKWE